MPDISAVRPVRRVYLGVEADPYDALSTVTWEEIAPELVRTTALTWGAQHELARVEPSRATVALDNSGGDFEALNPASPFYPDLRPLNRLRIVDTWDGDDYIRFTGYVTDWPRSWNGIGAATVQIEAYDALGAVLNAVSIPTTPWELQVRRFIEATGGAGGKAVWLRLGETGTVAVDSSGYRLDGQYQGTPLAVDGLIPFSDDKGTWTPNGARVSLPYKDLISGFPFSMACWFLCGTDLTGARMILSAYDGPSSGARQTLQFLILSTDFGVDAGKVVASIANPYPSGTTSKSTITVNDGLAHHLAIVGSSVTDIKIYIDGVDRTAVVVTTAAGFPNDLLTGYAAGNNPAATFGDFRFGYQVGDTLDELVVLDGYALSAAEVADLYSSGVAVPILPGISGGSGQRMAEVLDAIGWPSADSDIDAGKTAVQQNYVAGGLNGYMQRLDVTEGGRLFVDGSGVLTFQDRHRVLQAPYTVSQATFGEGPGEIGYHPPFNHGEDDADIFNDIPVGNVGGTVQVARDAASKARYGWKTLTGLTDLLGVSDEEARDRANRDLAIYKDPVTRIRQLVVKPQHEDPAVVWPALLGLGQNSRVTVKATPPGAALITQESHVERMEETVTAKDWQVTLGLSAAQTQEYAIWDTSTWGGARWSY